MEARQGYLVQVGPTTHETELHIITMRDAEGVGLSKGDKVELEFEGSAYTDGRRVEGTVVGTLTDVNPPLAF